MHNPSRSDDYRGGSALNPNVVAVTGRPLRAPRYSDWPFQLLAALTSASTGASKPAPGRLCKHCSTSGGERKDDVPGGLLFDLRSSSSPIRVNLGLGSGMGAGTPLLAPSADCGEVRRMCI